MLIHMGIVIHQYEKAGNLSEYFEIMYVPGDIRNTRQINVIVDVMKRFQDHT